MTTERPRDLIPGSGRRGPGRALDSVVSVRFDAPLLADARQMAAEDGQSLSDWIRNAVWQERARRQTEAVPPGLVLVGWSCQHLTMTSTPGVLGQVAPWCGCEMQPIHANAPAAA
jgi:hypothetical protein